MAVTCPDGELDEDTIDDIAQDVREHIEVMVSEPHEFAVAEHQPHRAVKVLAENYVAVSNAYNEVGGASGGGLDESILFAVSAWYSTCAARVAEHWEEKAEDVYNVLIDPE